MFSLVPKGKGLQTRSLHPQTRQQERGGGNEKNANSVVGDIALGLPDEGSRGSGERAKENTVLCEEMEKLGGRRKRSGGGD